MDTPKPPEPEQEPVAPHTLARRYFVEEGRRIPDILAAVPGLSRFQLGQWIAAGSWREAREAWILEHRVELRNGENSLESHRVTTAELIGMINEVVDDLRDPSLLSGLSRDEASAKIKLLRGRAAALKEIAEAMHLAVRLDRDVHGVRPGVPSAGKPKEVQEIDYVVRYRVEGEKTDGSQATG